MDYRIREMAKKEYPLLCNFLYEAIYVPEGVEPPPKSVLDSPALQVYIKNFGSTKQDFAFVAEGKVGILGAIWARIMQDYGHIDDHTPSLAMSVRKGYRGRGIGSALLKKMLITLQANGYENVSLSVQKENYAVKLYQKFGFHVFHETEEEYVMLVRL